MSHQALSRGITNIRPKERMTAAASVLKKSADRLVKRTKLDRNKVKKVKLKIKPAIIPNGLLLPPVVPLPKTIGRIGKMQGDKMVTIPPKKANRIKTSISLSI